VSVFISYARSDKVFAQRLASDLEAQGIPVWIDAWKIGTGDNIIEKIEHGLQEAQYIIVVLSKDSTKSPWVARELGIFSMREISRQERNVLPVLLEDCEIPLYLRDRSYADFRGSYEEGLRQLLRGIRPRTKHRGERAPGDEVVDTTGGASSEIQLKKLKEVFREGELSLFCGAGVSVKAGIPEWSALLRNLIGDLLRTGVVGTDSEGQQKDDLASFYQEYFNPSALIIAQYLKNNFGKDFSGKVREALYSSSPKTCDLIDAIVELCRPQRSRQSLHSIVTYNFDDLIEQNLFKNKIKHRSIFKEGQRQRSPELPVYHPHGFLPRRGRLTADHNIVFSEDAYHSQFIDAFSWANLVQLNHLNNYTCLFVGLSVTDPNLRRLLDVSMRKAPDNRLSHYVFRKRYDRKKIRAEMKRAGIKDPDNKQAEAFAKGAELLEEQDSKNMGLNVIWTDDYEEIPAFLHQLVED
jgi:hypothetical protein